MGEKETFTSNFVWASKFKQQKSLPTLDWVIMGSFLLFLVYIDLHDFMSGFSQKHLSDLSELFFCLSNTNHREVMSQLELRCKLGHCNLIDQAMSCISL